MNTQTQTVNVALFEKVKAHIRAEPARVNMGVFLVKDSGFGLPFTYEWSEFLKIILGQHISPACNTVGCIAGWAVFLSVNESEFPDDDLEERAQEVLGITRQESRELFHTYMWPVDLSNKLAMCKRASSDYAEVVCERIDRFLETKLKEQKAESIEPKT